MIENTYKVAGMSCAHCKAAVEEELGKVPGIERSLADIDANTVEMRYDENVVAVDDVRDAIERAGYALVL